MRFHEKRLEAAERSLTAARLNYMLMPSDDHLDRLMQAEVTQEFIRDAGTVAIKGYERIC